MDIATYRLNRTRGRFSENGARCAKKLFVVYKLIQLNGVIGDKASRRENQTHYLLKIFNLQCVSLLTVYLSWCDVIPAAPWHGPGCSKGGKRGKSTRMCPCPVSWSVESSAHLRPGLCWPSPGSVVLRPRACQDGRARNRSHRSLEQHGKQQQARLSWWWSGGGVSSSVSNWKICLMLDFLKDIQFIFEETILRYTICFGYISYKKLFRIKKKYHKKKY